MNNIIFYSKGCDFCDKLFDYISQVDSLDNYKLICVDDNYQKYSKIERTPTLLVKNHKTENPWTPLIGIHAFKWIKTKVQFNQPSNNVGYNPNKYLNKKDNPTLFDPEKDKLSKKNGGDFSFVFDDKDDKVVNKADNIEQKCTKIRERIREKSIKEVHLQNLMNKRREQTSMFDEEYNSELESSASRNRQQNNRKNRYTINMNDYDL